VKGYYRLAAAQISSCEYDSAIATIRQGLLVDNNNPQLAKQLRLAQQQKKVTLARQQSSQIASATSASQQLASVDGLSLDPALAKEFRELQNQYSQMSREYNTVQANVAKSQRECKVAEITCQELQGISDNSQCYRSVGKLFVKNSKTSIVQQLTKRIQDERSNEIDMNKKLEYMERQMTSLRQNMDELVKPNELVTP
jgi:prefoldin subunit 1